MPYSGPNDRSLPANVLKLSAVRRRQWLHVYESEKGKGSSDADAIIRANGVIKKQMGHTMAQGKNDAETIADLVAMIDADTDSIDGYEAIVAGQECGMGMDMASSYVDQLSQSEAAYDPFGATGGQGCATCRWFQSPNRCAVVMGEISPMGLSNSYRAKTVYSSTPPQVQLVDSDGDPIDFEDLLGSLTAGGMSLEPGWHASWTPTYIDGLPDSAFAWIDPGGKKDADGKTTPRSLRHFPYKDDGGKLDRPHVVDALGRVPQSHTSAVGKHAALVKLHAAARTLGVKLAPVEPAASTSERVVRAARGAAQNIMDFLGMGHPLDAEPLTDQIWLTGHEDGNSILPTPPGRLRYWTVSSNNFFDNKGKEFPEAAQHEYVDWVWVDPANRMPELQIWHTPDTRLGQADWIDFDGHFRHATGLIDAGKEDIARDLASDPENAMSWGYFVIWDEHDRAERFRGYEESILPRKYAGNSFTSFGLQEDSVAFTEPKRAYLKQVLGLSDDQIAARETRWEQFGQVVEGLGVSFHEVEQWVATEQAGAAPAPTPAPASAVTAPAPTSEVVAAAPAAGAQDSGLATQAMTPESLSLMLSSLMEAQLRPLQDQLAGIHSNQQAFEGRVAAVLPAVRTLPAAGFDATRAADTIPGAIQTPSGQPVAAAHDANGALVPLNPDVLKAIAAGAQEQGGKDGVDWMFNRLATQHPLLNGQPTETRG